MRKDAKIGMFIGIGLIFVGWVLFAMRSDTLQERRQKQLASEPAVSKPVQPFTPSEKQIDRNPTQPSQQAAKPVQPVPVQASVQIHVVETGQTLSSISTLYYGTGEQWTKILEANSDILQSPTQLRPGMRLKIPAR
jgi:nucleoid-associated protein YgaU